MGHFYSTNVSKVAIRLFEDYNERLGDGVSIADVVTVLKRNGETIHAAEGEYSEDYMLSYGVEQLFFGWQEHCDCIEPSPETKEQQEILRKWEEDPFNFDEKDYNILDTIPWITTGEHMPIIDYIPS